MVSLICSMGWSCVGESSRVAACWRAGWVFLLIANWLQNVISVGGGFTLLASSSTPFTPNNDKITAIEFYGSSPSGNLFAGGRADSKFFQGNVVFSGDMSSAAININTVFSVNNLDSSCLVTVMEPLPYSDTMIIAVTNVVGNAQLFSIIKVTSSTTSPFLTLLSQTTSGTVTNLVLYQNQMFFAIGPSLSSWSVSSVAKVTSSSYTNAAFVSPVATAASNKLVGVDFKTTTTLIFDGTTLDAISIVSELSDLQILHLKTVFSGTMVLACTSTSCYSINLSTGSVWSDKTSKISMIKGGSQSLESENLFVAVGMENPANLQYTAVFSNFFISPPFTTYFKSSLLVVNSSVTASSTLNVTLSANGQTALVSIDSAIHILKMQSPPTNCNISTNTNGDQPSQICKVCMPNFALTPPPPFPPGGLDTCQNIVCDTTCASCFGPSNDDCLSCNSPLELKGTICRYPCPTGCTKCAGLVQFDCEVCQSDLWLTSGQCVKCPAGCLECLTDSICTRCEGAGSSLWEGKCYNCSDADDFHRNSLICTTGFGARFVDWYANVEPVRESGKDTVKEVTITFQLPKVEGGVLSLSSQTVDKGFTLNSSRKLSLRYHRVNQILLIFSDSMLPGESVDLEFANTANHTLITTILDPPSKQIIEYRMILNRTKLRLTTPNDSLSNDPFWNELNSNIVQASQGMLVGFSVLGMTKSFCGSNFGGSFIQMFQIVELFGKLYYTPVIFSSYTQLMLGLFQGMNNIISVSESSIITQPTTKETSYHFKLSRAATEKDLLRSNPVYAIIFVVGFC